MEIESAETHFLYLADRNVLIDQARTAPSPMGRGSAQVKGKESAQESH